MPANKAIAGLYISPSATSNAQTLAIEAAPRKATLEREIGARTLCRNACDLVVLIYVVLLRLAQWLHPIVLRPLLDVAARDSAWNWVKL